MPVPRPTARRATFLTILAAFSLAACSDGGTAPVAAPDADASVNSEADATVYVVHGINGTDLGLPESLPVDVSVNGACALPNFTFRTITGGIALPAGSYDIVVRLANASPCTGTAVINASGVALAGGKRYSIVAHLDAAGGPTASVFPQRLKRRSGEALLGAYHAAAFTPVDILVNGRAVYRNLANGTGRSDGFPAVSGVQVGVAPAGTSTPVFSATLNLAADTFYGAYAVGTPSKGTFEVLLQAIPAN